ncbi:MAG: exosortase/archaeosortase family protein [Bryobacteraceae bacterium]|nr:exosortase/archaeosortase family protein [Bryobacteraceae bacterium]
MAEVNQTSQTLVSRPADVPGLLPLPLSLLAIGGLLAVCFGPVLYRLAQLWTSDENMSHGFFVPLVAGYIAWQKRDQLGPDRWQRNYLGLIPVLIGAVMLCVGPPSIPTFVTMGRVAFLFSLAGCILFLGGIGVLRTLAYPLAMLPLMIPFPFYDMITLPLQLMASVLSEQTLSLLGVSVLREGNVLFLSTQTLSVAEACSGLRSLYSLVFLTLAYAYLFADRRWVRWALVASIVPIAIAANSLRVTATALLGAIDAQYTHGIYHDMLGWSVFVIAFGLLCLWHLALVRMGKRTVTRKAATA